jgi:hypothetical protein
MLDAAEIQTFGLTMENENRNRQQVEYFADFEIIYCDNLV